MSPPSHLGATPDPGPAPDAGATPDPGSCTRAAWRSGASPRAPRSHATSARTAARATRTNGRTGVRKAGFVIDTIILPIVAHSLEADQGALGPMPAGPGGLRVAAGKTSGLVEYSLTKDGIRGILRCSIQTSTSMLSRFCPEAGWPGPIHVERGGP